MQRRHFMKLTGMLATLPAIKGIAATSEKPAPSGKQLYEWRIYTLEEDADGLDGFFRDTLIPAYNRKNIKAGAFVPYKKEEKERRLLLFIYPNITTYHRVKRTIWDDTVFRKAAQPYFDKTAPNPAYFNFESFLCEAFDKVPSLLMPDKNRTLFELRTYHSPNEEANQRKVAMFNKDEIDVFDKVGINSVCYGEVLAGPIMPAVMYLTWCRNIPTAHAATRHRAGRWKRSSTPVTGWPPSITSTSSPTARTDMRKVFSPSSVIHLKETFRQTADKQSPPGHGVTVG